MAQPKPGLPFDIWPLITDILGDEMRGSRGWPKKSEVLRALSLTCKALVPVCRKHLFFLLRMPDQSKIQRRRLLRLRDVISRNPQIVKYIQHIEYYVRPPKDEHWTDILDAIRNHSMVLKSVLIQAYQDWKTYPVSLQYSLEQLIRLPSVTHLDLIGLTQVPRHIPAIFPNLTHLILIKATFIETSDTGSSLRPRPVSLKGSVMDSSFLKAIDFTGLKEMGMQFSIEDRNFICDLIRTTKNLESLNLLLIACSLLDFSGLGAALSVHAISTLNCLSLKIMEENDDPPLRGLVSELSRIAGTNVLEEIYLRIIFDKDVEYHPDTEDWGAFDTLVTNPGSFPKLKLVSMIISWDVTYWTPIEQHEVNLNKITDKDFPALLKNDVIEFSFSVENKLITYTYDGR